MSVHVLASQHAPGGAISRDFTTLCLWSVCGLALSSLFWIAGFGLEITQTLAAAG